MVRQPKQLVSDVFPSSAPLVHQTRSFRSVKNLQFNTTLVPPEVVYVFYRNHPRFSVKPNYRATCIHWQVSQATSLYNLVFKLSTVNGTQHRAILMENGR